MAASVASDAHPVPLSEGKATYLSESVKALPEDKNRYAVETRRCDQGWEGCSNLLHTLLHGDVSALKEALPSLSLFRLERPVGLPVKTVRRLLIEGNIQDDTRNRIAVRIELYKLVKYTTKGIAKRDLRPHTLPVIARMYQASRSLDWGRSKEYTLVYVDATLTRLGASLPAAHEPGTTDTELGFLNVPELVASYGLSSEEDMICHWIKDVQESLVLMPFLSDIPAEEDMDQWTICLDMPGGVLRFPEDGYETVVPRLREAVNQACKMAELHMRFGRGISENLTVGRYAGEVLGMAQPFFSILAMVDSRTCAGTFCHASVCVRASATDMWHQLPRALQLKVAQAQLHSWKDMPMSSFMIPNEMSDSEPGSCSCSETDEEEEEEEGDVKRAKTLGDTDAPP